jgi:hypothetical protein
MGHYWFQRFVCGVMGAALSFPAAWRCSRQFLCRQFVAEYGGVGAYVGHLLYYWGLFGMRDRIRQADIVLLGSSHTQFGLSARQLSEILSRESGRPIKAFNLGLGCS